LLGKARAARWRQFLPGADLRRSGGPRTGLSQSSAAGSSDQGMAVGTCRPRRWWWQRHRMGLIWTLLG
jgi:hypothetical protein